MGCARSFFLTNQPNPIKDNSPMTTNQPKRDHSAFAKFLAKPIEEASFNLTDATLLECIQKKIQIRRMQTPKSDKQKSLIKSLKSINDELGYAVTPAQVNEEFWGLYTDWLMDLNYKPSTIRTMICQIKAALTWASQYQAKISRTYNRVTLPTIEQQTIALTPDEISLIWHKDLSGISNRKDKRESIEKTKDMICLMCNIGLRYSDARRLTKDHFKDGVIHILQQKTKKYAHIDIYKMCIHRDMTIAILEKYDYNAPLNIDISEFNKRLHELINYCGFTEEVQIETVVNGKVTTYKKQKKQLITSHTARRTFVVNNAIRKVPHIDIMTATGHKTYAALDKYLSFYKWY